MTHPVIVVTGASSGIGEAFARLAASKGASLALVARRGEVLKKVAADCGANALPVVADVTRRADVERIVAETIARFGHIDVWINNVGQGITRNPSELTDEDIDAVMQVNVKSALYGMQAVLPHFKARGTGQVINVSSMLGRTPMAVIRSAYCGAKHFLNALTATFRAEVEATHPGIQFSLVSPGVVRTDFGLNAMYGGPDSRSFPMSQSAEEVAAVVWQAVETRQPDLYTTKGAKERVLGYLAGLTADPQ
jgi:NADP-dependent 3-hydroxy acid dehydrogenase YdfG